MTFLGSIWHNLGREQGSNILIVKKSSGQGMNCCHSTLPSKEEIAWTTTLSLFLDHPNKIMGRIFCILNNKRKPWKAYRACGSFCVFRNNALIKMNLSRKLRKLKSKSNETTAFTTKMYWYLCLEKLTLKMSCRFGECIKIDIFSHTLKLHSINFMPSVKLTKMYM